MIFIFKRKMKKRSPNEIAKIMQSRGQDIEPAEVAASLTKIASKLRRIYPGLPDDDERLLNFISRFIK